METQDCPFQSITIPQKWNNSPSCPQLITKTLHPQRRPVRVEKNATRRGGGGLVELVGMFSEDLTNQQTDQSYKAIFLEYQEPLTLIMRQKLWKMTLDSSVNTHLA